ncbi:MAG: ankyrin repeat domain-containing protein [Polyangiaceae bacterium]|nr:ankyrin repeat domain-containing protein [Polyangiaceae bacterium]
MQFLTYIGLDIPKKLAASFEKVRASIERDDLRSADVKKLSNREFYRAKLDYDARLLLSFVEHSGRRACLALELIEKHAYDRSRFLRGARVNEDDACEVTPASDVAALEQVKPARYLHPGRTTFHMLEQPISFDDRQAEIHTLPLPLIVVGCAGSGKTALTLTKLREIPGHVLYVTQSAFLAENAASLYFAHGYENSHQSVDFLSFAKLLASVEVPRGRPVTLGDFRGFFERIKTNYKFTSAHQLFEELRGVITASPGGPLSEEAYLELGVRQSIYSVEQRRLIYPLLAKYRAWLDERGLYDPNLVSHAYVAKAEAHYDAIVVDEVQDFTNAELSLVLAMLKAPRQFLLCGDANQIVHPNFFSWSKVKSLFYSHEKEALEAKVHVLEANYRSSKTVCELANALLKVKNARFGSVDRESTALVMPASALDGRVVGLVKKDGVLRELDKRLRGSARVAVIVLNDEQKAEAKQRFATPLIFSVHEAKGLEYDAVILYDMVSTERAVYGELASGISQSVVDADALKYARAKDRADKSLEIYKFFVNGLYVALTRAVETIYMIESDVEHPLLGLLRVTFSEDVSACTAKASSLEDWQREARKLELQGKQEQADAIRRTILRITPVPWNVLDDEGFVATYDKVFAPGSVFTKAKQQLYDFAAFHQLSPLGMAIKNRAAYQSPKNFADTGTIARERFLPAYRGKDTGRVMTDVTRHGVEHRNMMGLTPLMMAAYAGNVALVTALRDLGARVDAVDTFGRMPFHFALRSAFHDASFAREKMGALYELLCPTGVDVEVHGRLVRIARSDGEFFVLATMLALFFDLYGSVGIRQRGFTTAMLDEAKLEAFPRTVVPEERRRRTYWNSVLARAEVDSNYRPARKLWRRERMGHYVPSDVALLRTTDDRGQEKLRSLRDILRIGLLDGYGAGARGEVSRFVRAR